MAKSIYAGRPINGTGQADKIYGDGVAREMFGRGGDDLILGHGVTYDASRFWYSETANSSFDEFIYGGAGDDSLAGGGGNDVLDGGAGTNELWGGSGADVFVTSVGAFARIGDFSPTLNPLVRVDFEALPDGGVPDGYHGLIWSDNVVVTAPLDEEGPPGYDQALNSGYHMAYDATGEGISVSAAQVDFDFAGGAFAAAWYEDITVTVNAYDDGELVGTVAFQPMHGTKAWIDLEAGVEIMSTEPVVTGRVTSIDALSITTSGATTADRGRIALDDLMLRFPTGGDGDRIDIPDDVDVAAMIANAYTGYFGGTILSFTGGGGMILSGVTPALLQADWFF